MRYIVRPIPAHLMLVDTESGPVTYALPDTEFWEWLRLSGEEAKLEAEDPDRMERVRANGVGVLRCNKQVLLDAGFATRDETLTKRPPERPVLLAVATKE